MKGVSLSYFYKKHIYYVEVIYMRSEIKVSIMSFLLCCMFMLGFTYVNGIGEKVYYVYQVGIYKDASNRDNKIEELESKGFDSYSYLRDDQYYVLSMISDNLEEVEEHSQAYKGIIKQYTVSYNVSKEGLLNVLEQGVKFD